MQQSPQNFYTNTQFHSKIEFIQQLRLRLCGNYGCYISVFFHLLLVFFNKPTTEKNLH
jgi:hypothetical protein